MSEQTYSAKIVGMHCAACSTRIEKVVGSLPGVSSCAVNLATEQARIDFDADKVTNASIVAAITQLGFGVATESQNSEALQSDATNTLAAMRLQLLPAFVLAFTVMALSMAHMLGISLPESIDPMHSPLRHALLQFLLTLPALYFGRSFYLLGLPALFRFVPTMDSLIAIGTGAAFSYSVWQLLEIGLGADAIYRVHDLYFESAAMLIAMVLLGKYLEARSKIRTSDAIRQLLRLTPDIATLIDEQGQRQVPVGMISVGEHILIRPGERIPVDGVIVNGESVVDESMLTGESVPVPKSTGDMLYAGTYNNNGSLTMQAGKVGSDTVLAQIVKLVQEAQGTKAPIARLADQISLYFVPVVMAIATFAGLSWYFLGAADFAFSLRIFIAVLVIACPCAMGLATPTSIMVGTGRGAQLGVLVKTGAVLEIAHKVTCVVFDKTGTLTKGRPEVTEIIPLADYDEQALLSFASGVESRSEHPLAAAILRAAKEKGCPILPPSQFRAIPGRGIDAVVEKNGKERRVLLGNIELMRDNRVSGVTDSLQKKAATLSGQAQTVLFLAIDDILTALLVVADPLKVEAADTVERLEKMGIEVVMLTGDNELTAQAVARQAGISRVVAGVMPNRKEQEIVRLQQEGKIVAMVGDGINDAPALARADVGIAMGTGIDIAVESADIVLMTGHLSGVCRAFGLSRATLGNIRQNLFWAFAYNIVGIPVAAGVLAIFGGPTLNPMIGGAAMALSSVSVITNALRLRFYKPEE